MADETAKLVIAVDSRSATKATDDLDRLTASSAKAEVATGKLGSTSSTAGRAVQASTTATSAAAVSAGKLAETEEEAAKRIHDMVQASLAAVEASKASAAAQATQAAQGREGAAAAKALADAQTAQMARWTALRAPVAQVQALLSKTTLTTAEVAKAEQLLDRAQAAGVITSGELKEAFAALDVAKVKDIAVTEAQAVAHKKAGLSSRAQAEIATAASEVMSGNFGRLRRTGAAFANQAGLLSKLMNPLALGITAVVGTVGLLAVAYAKGEAEQQAFNKALILTGGYAGQTAGQLDAMAESMEGVGGATRHAAAAVLAQVVQSGKFVGDQVKTVTAAALEMQQATGQAVDKTIDQFVKLGKDPVQGLLELNESMHFLTQATYDQVTALAQRGQADKAASVAQDAYAAAVKQRAQDVQDHLGLLQRVWDGLGTTAKWAWDQMLDIGRPTTLSDKVEQYRYQIALAQKTLAGGGLSKYQQGQVEKTIAALQARLTQLENQQRAAGGFEAGQNLANRLIGERIAAQDALTSGAGAPAQSTLTKRLSELAEQKAKALMGVVDPDKRQEIITAFNAQVAEAAHQYDQAEKKLAPPGAGAGRGSNPLAGLQSLVKSGSASSLIVPNNQPVTEYVQTVAKLTTAFDQARAKGADLGAAEDLFAKGVADANVKLKAQQEQIQRGNDIAFAQFKSTLDQQVAAQRNAIDLQVESVGMGQKEAERMRQLNELDQQRIQQIERLQLAQKAANDPAQYAQLQRQIDATNASFRDMRDTMIDGFHRVDQAQGDWVNGLIGGLQDWADNAGRAADQMRNFVGGAFDDMADALGNFVTTGKLDVKSLVASILSDFAKMEMRIAASKLLTTILGYFTGGGSVDTSNIAAGNFSGPRANGGVFGPSGEITAFATGGIVSSPTLFRHVGGYGVMGEAGKEAIMPLATGPDGKLGVRATGGGATVVVNQSYTINNSGSGGNSGTQSQQSDAMRQFQKRMKDVAQQTILDEQRPGGSLWRMAHAS